MSESTKHLEHYRIASQVPEAEFLAHGSTSLPTFVMHNISAGEVVPLAKQHAIQADFGEIEIRSNEELLTDFADFKQRLQEDAGFDKTIEAFNKLPEDQKDLFSAALFAAELANSFFAVDKLPKDVRDSEGWQPIDGSREDTYHLKKLSETSDQGYCVEYSLFTGEVLRRLGKDTSYTVGYYRYWPDEPGEYHAFLTADNSRIIIDPLAMANSKNPQRPQGLLIAAEQSVFDDPASPHNYNNVLFSNTRATYSASPIPVLSSNFEAA